MANIIVNFCMFDLLSYFTMTRVYGRTAVVVVFCSSVCQLLLLGCRFVYMLYHCLALYSTGAHYAM